MKKFDIPDRYRSSIIGEIKRIRHQKDPRKKDYTPSLLDLGPLRFHIARHFGFCYGVENAIEIAYKALEEHPDRRIYLLSQMIHNPIVNDDLARKGMRFIQDTKGNRLIDLDEISPEDIVIIPAFGTTIETEQELKARGIEVKSYDTTCPFVTAVWKRAHKLGEKDHSIVIHGKPEHEETRATFSHSRQKAKSVIVRDMEETKLLGEFVKGERPVEEFYKRFEGRYSEGFDADQDLERIGVVNQTTMLASETKAISEHLQECMIERYGEDRVQQHFADTSDTLCYATNDNQKATFGLLEKEADLALIVGGYNSSNTSHIVELCGEKLPSYFIRSAEEIEKEKLRHFDVHRQEERVTRDFLPEQGTTDILLTSGASCPDSSVDEVLRKVMSFFPNARNVDDALEEMREKEGVSAG
ncbi:MAG: 4-hydroxy-3-methylbut-2-enyl diphosphate reductase [Flavobacteriales bacterium]